MIDVGMRVRAAAWYALARDAYELRDWYTAIHAQRIACLIWHLADPDLTWSDLVHC